MGDPPVAGGFKLDADTNVSLLNFGNRRRLPLIRQSEAAECGLACLAMVASYHQHHITLVEMRHRFTSSLKGMTLERMLEIARAIGLNSRPIKVDMGELAQVNRPAILHWDLNHFVVLRSITDRKITIYDPAVGERTLSLSEAAKH